MTPGLLIAAALRRDRLLVVFCMLFVVVLSWAYLLAGAGMMQEMGDMLMPMSTGPWALGHAVVVLVMWSVMMVAMMLPSAAPMILLYATMARRRSERGEPVAASGTFALGYLAVWAEFSLAAAALQFGLVEKLGWAGHWIGRGAGVLLVVWGGATLLAAT